MSIVTESTTLPAAPVRAAIPARRLSPGWEAALLRSLTAILLIGGWELSTRTGLANPFFIGRPSAIAMKLWEWFFVTGKIYPHLGVTLLEVGLGLLFGATLGIVAGLALAKWPRLNTALDPFIMGFYGMPRAALAPLFIIWFGIGLQSKIIFAGFVAFFVLLINTYTGIKSVDNDLLNAVRTMGGQGTFLYRKIVLPSCVPWIFSGLRLGLAFALTGAVFAEMLSSEMGVGLLIATSAGIFDTTTVLACVLILAVVAMAMNEIMKLLERRLLRWREQIIL